MEMVPKPHTASGVLTYDFPTEAMCAPAFRGHMDV